MIKHVVAVACLFVAAAGAVTPLAAQSASPPAPGYAAAEMEIRALEEQERSAVVAQDFTTLERIWDQNFIVNSPANVISQDRAAVFAVFRKGLARYTAFERVIEQIRINGDIAIVMGSETVRPNGTAPRAGETVKRRFSHVWKRDGAVWKLIARHANNVGTTS